MRHTLWTNTAQFVSVFQTLLTHLTEPNTICSSKTNASNSKMPSGQPPPDHCYPDNCQCHLGRSHPGQLPSEQFELSGLILKLTANLSARCFYVKNLKSQIYITIVSRPFDNFQEASHQIYYFCTENIVSMS